PAGAAAGPAGAAVCAPLPSAGQAADQSARCAAAADHCGTALSFTLAGLCVGAGAEVIAGVVHPDAGKSDREDRAALEAFRRFCVAYDSGGVSPLRNRYSA